MGEAVWEDVCSRLKDPSRITKEHTRRLTQSHKNDNLNSLIPQAQKVKRGIGRLIDIYQDGHIDREEFESRLSHSKQRLGKREEQIVTLSQAQDRDKNSQRMMGHVETFAKRVEGSLAQAAFSTKREVIRALVKQIEIGEQDVKIVYKVDSLPFVQAPEKGVLQHCLRRA